MKKVLIVSDTHGYSDLLNELIKLVKPVDLMVHCGDVGYRGAREKLSFAAGCPVYLVSGNNDYGYDYPMLERFRMEGHEVIVTHGHRQRVYYDLTPLYYFAEENGADIVMFGHLHMPVVQKDGGIILVNPGSLTYPRQSNGLPSYIIMTVEDDGILKFAVRYIKVTGHGLEITG